MELHFMGTVFFHAACFRKALSALDTEPTAKIALALICAILDRTWLGFIRLRRSDAAWQLSENAFWHRSSRCKQAGTVRMDDSRSLFGHSCPVLYTAYEKDSQFRTVQTFCLYWRSSCILAKEQLVSSCAPA